MNSPNKPDAVNPAMALWFAVEDQWRRVTELGSLGVGNGSNCHLRLCL
jgi:hypothetical protein